jgi:hypothetical protein
MRSLLLLPLLAAFGTGAAAAEDAVAARQRLAAERSAIETRYRAEEAACRERFAVTPCIEQARAQRREALAKVREQELRWDDQDRRQRADLRERAIAGKRAEAAARAASGASAPAPAKAAPRPPLVASAPAHVAAPAPRAPLDGGPQAANERVLKAQQRQAQAAARAERIRQREAERAKQGKKAAPLPEPAKP